MWFKLLSSLIFSSLLQIMPLNASEIDQQICIGLKKTQTEMALKLPYQIGEFWFNTQFNVNCDTKTVYSVKKHTVLKVDEFETSTSENFRTQIRTHPLCNNAIFKNDLGWKMVFTLQDVEGIYVTSANLSYQTCNK